MSFRQLGTRAAEMLLRLVVGDRNAYEGLLGDLREELSRPARTRRQPDSPAGAGRENLAGYRGAILGLAAHYLLDRLRRGRRATGHPGTRPRSRRRLLSGVGGDLRHALRLPRRRPGFAAAVIVTLGLGFGATAAVSSFAYGVWLRPLPFADAEQLVRIYESRVEGGGGNLSHLSPPLLRDLRAGDWASLHGVAAVSSANYDWERGNETHRASAYVASRGVFDVLGIEPVAGRFFSSAPGSREVVVGEGLWRRALGGDTNAIGTEYLLLDGNRYLVVGVVRDDLPYPQGRRELWTPLDHSADELSDGMRGARYLDVIGRLRPGMSPAAATEELDAFVGGLGADHQAHQGWGATAVSLREDLVRPFLGLLRLLLAAAALFLLIACSNVAGLVATRRVRTAAERDVRRALGASRGRIVRQEVVEMLVLCTAAAVLAALVATGSMAPLRRLAPADLPRIAEIRPETAIILIVAGVLVACGAMLVLLAAAFRRGADGAAPGDSRTVASAAGGRSALMVGQVAVTTVLLLAGIAIGEHFRTLAGVRAGFEPEGLAAAQVLLSDRVYPDGASRVRFFEGLVEGLRERGYAVAAGVNPPISGSSVTFGYRAGDGGATDPGQRRFGQHHAVTPGYFAVLGIPLRAGRDFTAADGADATPVVVINETLARAHFGGDPIGQEMTVVSTPRRIIGVVGSVAHFGPDREPPPEMYVPLAQSGFAFGHVLLRAGDRYRADAVQQVAAAIDPDVPVPALLPYDDYISRWFAPLRFQLTLISLLTATGAALAMVGLYGLIAFVVADRRREIGIRAALGENSRSIFVGVVGRGVALAVAGFACGLAGALGLRRVVGSLVAGLATDEPLVAALAAVVVLTAAAAATAWPARRASRVDPAEVLRRN